MPIDVNWVSGVIFVPKTYMALLQALPEIRGLDVDQFRHDLKDLEASVVGAIYTDTHVHNGEVTIAGVLYARGVSIIPPYTVEFEEDTQRWASDVLSRSTEDLSTDLGVVSSLLRGAQAIVRSPVGRVTLLAGALVAAALPVVLVAHDSRPLTAVYVDGAWRYADPNADAALGTHLPFVRERFFSVPDLPAPERSLLQQEIEALRKQIVLQQEQIAQLSQMVAEQFQIQTRRSDGEVWKTVAIIAVAAAVILLLVQVQQQSDRRST
jgi:hypothetical protein